MSRREGEARRDAAMVLLEAHRTRLILRCQRAVVRMLLERGPDGSVTSDDVRDEIEIPPQINPNMMGAVFRVLALRKVIHHRRGEWVTSRRAPRHANECRVWRLIDRDRGERWLAENPEPEPEDLVGAFREELF